MSSTPGDQPPHDPNQPPPPPGGYGEQPSHDPNQPPPPPSGYGQQPSYDPGASGYGQPPPPPGGYGQQPSYDPGASSYGQPAPPQGGFGMPGSGGQPQTNGLAIGALVVGILGLLGNCFCFGGILSPVAVFLGRAGMKKADTSGGRVGQRGLAKAGFIMGIIGTVIFLLLIAWFIVALATDADFNYQYGGNLD